MTDKEFAQFVMWLIAGQSTAIVGLASYIVVIHRQNRSDLRVLLPVAAQCRDVLREVKELLR